MNKSQFLQNYMSSLDIKTYDEPQNLDKFKQFLKTTYPTVFENATIHVDLPNELFFEVKGQSNNSQNIICFAHYDVVPVDAESWDSDPWTATVKTSQGEIVKREEIENYNPEETYIYARGAIDDKISLMGFIQALNDLLADGFRPQNNLFFSFSGDEEVAGTGSREALKYADAHNIHFVWANDETGFVVKNIIPGINPRRPVAMVNVAEKGFVNLRLSVEQAAGHASIPPQVQAPAVLGAALSKIGANPFPHHFNDVNKDFLDSIGPYIEDEALKTAVQKCENNDNNDFFELATNVPEFSALFKTTNAITLLEGSKQSNVLPGKASATLNIRLLPPHTPASAQAYIAKIIDDSRVKIEIEESTKAVTPRYNFKDNPGWPVIQTAIKKTFPDAIIAPSTAVANTDSRFFFDACDCVFRFAPQVLDPISVKLAHNHNECLSVQNVVTALEFYTALFEQC